MQSLLRRRGGFPEKTNGLYAFFGALSLAERRCIMDDKYKMLLLCILFLLGSSLSGCRKGESARSHGQPEQPQQEPYPDEREPCAQDNPLKNVYFGDLHVHTSLSFDAWLWDVRVPPRDAYAFARGEPIWLPPLDENGQGTRMVQLAQPLDFMAVTDHAEFLAEVEQCVTPGAPAYGSLTCVIFRQKTPLSTIFMASQLFFPHPQRARDICGPGRLDCPALIRGVWRQIIDAAEDAYDRTSDCSFTTFVGYEYTGVPDASNLHRNVIFRNERVPPLPVSYIEEPTPWGLWARLERECLQGIPGCDVVAIPHNSNESNGNKFYVEYPGAASIDEERAMASLRQRMEPLVEVFQHKGDSECMNGLSGVAGQPDELCAFEKIRAPDTPDCGDRPGSGGVLNSGCVSRLDFVRFVLLEGLREEERIGVNPFKLGMIGSTDTHNATGGAVLEDRFVGHAGTSDDTVVERFQPDQIVHNPGGLVAVWAEQNTRNAIFDGLKRREVYGTSGPRIVVRLFGGWHYPDDMCSRADFVALGYQYGVPMGSDIAPRPEIGAYAPKLAVMAIREPDVGSRKGTPLQRIQIVKGWIAHDGRLSYKVFDVAGDPHNGAGVDLATCQTTGNGFDTLCTVWTDPEFDATRRAFYYARVIENPTCRWSTYDCMRSNPETRPAYCDDPHTVKTIQERAWTSPIWYRPHL